MDLNEQHETLNTESELQVAEHYMLSAIHAFSCSVFSLRKLLSNRSGAYLSLGYDEVSKDPLSLFLVKRLASSSSTR